MGFEGIGQYGATDGGAVDALELARPCPTATALEDDFSDSFRGAEWSLIEYFGITVDETGGALRISYTSTTPGGQFGGYIAAVGGNVERSCVTGLLSTAPAPGAYAFLTLGSAGGDDKIEVAVTGSGLSWWYSNNGLIGDLPSPSSDPQVVRYVRLQRGPFAPGQSEFTLEASDDGLTFVVLARTNLVPFDLANATVRIGGGLGEPVATDGLIEWTDVQLAVP